VETGERRVLLAALVSPLALDDLLLAARVIRNLLLLGLASVVVGVTLAFHLSATRTGCARRRPR
jgi:hypothetical protein